MTAAERLTEALEQAGAPSVMIANARRGAYGDFTSEFAMPITKLVEDATKAGLPDIAKRAMNGDFDGE
jgi:hypothetical protein